MSRHLSTRNILAKSMHAFLSSLATRQTDEHGQTHLPSPLSEVTTDSQHRLRRCSRVHYTLHTSKIVFPPCLPQVMSYVLIRPSIKRNAGPIASVLEKFYNIYSTASLWRQSYSLQFLTSWQSSNVLRRLRGTEQLSISLIAIKLRCSPQRLWRQLPTRSQF